MDITTIKTNNNLGTEYQLTEANLLASANICFECYDPENANTVVKVATEVVDTLSHTANSNVRPYSVTLLDANGALTTKQAGHIHFIEACQNQDLLDLVVYTFLDGQIKIAVNEVICVPVAARHVLSAGKLSESAGLMFTLPNLAIDDLSLPKHQAFRIAASEILINKVGLDKSEVSLDKLASLGGCYFPSIGGTTIAYQMLALAVEQTNMTSRITYGTGLNGHTKLSWLSPQDIVSGFLNGEIKDLRLVLAAFRIARHLGQPIKIAKELGSSEIYSAEKIINNLTIVDHKSAVAWIKQATLDQTDSAQVALIPDRTPQANDFVKEIQISARNISIKNQELGEAYSVFMAKRRTTDSVGASGHCFIKDGNAAPELYMLVVQNIRPAIKVREMQPTIHSNIQVRNTEGVAGCLEEGDIDIGHIIERAIAEVQEEGGVQAVSGQHIGQYFPLPQHGPELKHACMVSIDPTRPSSAEHTADESVKRALMRPKDIIKLAEQGLIHEPSLELMAHLLT